MANKLRKILVTGVNGFIGSRCAELLRRKYVVAGLDTHSVCLQDNVDIYVPMVLPNGDLAEVIKAVEPEYCIHCAGAASVGFSMTNPAVDFESGPGVVFGLMESIRKSGVGCKVVFLSSAAVYGNPQKLPVKENSVLSPVSPYGYHKMMCEQILEEFRVVYGVESVILRVFSCYGDGLRKQLIWDLCNKMHENKCELYGTGKETRDFIHVDDLVRLIEIVIDSGLSGEIFNAGVGRQYSVAEVARLVAGQMDYSIEGIKFCGQEREGDPKFWEADVSQIRSIGFKPLVTIEEGIVDYVKWFREVCNEKCYEYA